eukprot:2673819-Amphidinium_carterae.1
MRQPAQLELVATCLRPHSSKDSGPARVKSICEQEAEDTKAKGSVASMMPQRKYLMQLLCYGSCVVM